MKENKFTDELRLYGTDSEGHRVLVGLTYRETREYGELVEKRHNLNEADAVRFLDLHSRHESVRRSTAG